MKVDWLNRFIELMWPYLDKVWSWSLDLEQIFCLLSPYYKFLWKFLFFSFQAICKTATTIAKPIIAEQIPKYKIDSVDFEALSLGSLPPTFQCSVDPNLVSLFTGTHTYSSFAYWWPTHFCFPLIPGMKIYVTDEKELILEPALRWAGNPNVLVAVKAFGLRATVQVFSSLFPLSLCSHHTGTC